MPFIWRAPWVPAPTDPCAAESLPRWRSRARDSIAPLQYLIGFFNEVGEQPLRTDIPAPLKLIYSQRRELVVRLTGRDPTRVLSFLFPDPLNEAKAI